MAAHPGVSAAPARPTNRWSSHRVQAVLLRATVYLAPIAASIAFVHYAGEVVPAPLSSLWVYLAWWFGLSLAATGVLVAIDRVVRRLLPLAALLQLSLVFPDEAPSRFKVAFKAGDVDALEARIAAKEAAATAATPAEAAERLLELVAALNIHDPLTRGHCDRVRAYSVMIGEELHLSRDELDLLNWAALLHDVGKLEVPTEILAKDGRPTAEEWQALRRHPLEGETLVEPMRSWLGTWTSAVGFHHERWDGKGYPRGLAGEEIPLPGRIVAVADVFDVITSARSYKKASAAEDARAEIARCAGAQFDPEVVRAFLNVSLGRMRFVMGPLSWLAHAPLLGRLPLTPALGTAAGVIGVVATSAATGLAGPETPVTAAAAATPPAVIHHVAPRPGPVRSVLRPHVFVRVAHGKPEASSRAVAPPRPRPAPPVPAAASPPAASPAPAAPPPAPPTPSAPAPTPVPVAAPPRPAFTPGPDLVVREDDPPFSAAWATDIAPGTRFVASTSPAGLFAALPGVAPDGRLGFRLAADAYGTADVAVTPVDDARQGDGHMLRIDVLPVNDAPSFTSGGDVTVAEDSGAFEADWASSISPGPPNESAQHVRFSVATDTPALFAPGGAPLVDEAGRLSFTPAFLASGAATVTVTETDDGGTENGGVDSTTKRFRIVVARHNHAPHVRGIGDLSVPEDSPAQTVQWVTSVDPGAPDESGQIVTLTAASDHPELFAVQPAISATGVLTYTPAADAFGAATVTLTAIDDGGTGNGGHDRSVTQFTIRLRPVNDAPSFSGGGDVTVFENAAAQSRAWASAISSGPPNESSQTVAFATSSDNPTLFAAGGEPAVAPDGTLTFTPAFGASGTARVTVRATDSGGTADGGVDSATAAFLVHIVAVNQPPSFQAGGNVTVFEDAGPQSIPWATAVSPGPNEGTQQVAFQVSNTNNALFSAQPAIDSTGRLTFTSAANAYGTATVTVAAKDDGGTADGGVDTSAPASFTLTVTPVNDEPSFADGGNVTVLEDSGVYGSPWASAISPGPNEAAQNVSFTVSNDASSLFSVQPSLDAGGTLRFAPAPNAYGSATVTVVADDDGGTAEGGADRSAPVTFSLTVMPVNDAPTFLPGGNVTALEDAGAQDEPWATATSPGPNEPSQQVTFTVTTTNGALFAVQPAIDATNGHLSFTPAPDANGSVTVTVVAADDGGTANGGADQSAPVTFTLTVTPVNDAPTIGSVSAQSANEDDGPQTAALTTFSPGPADESGQTLTVTTTVLDHPEYFEPTGQPAVDSSGNLSYTPATGAYGTATVEVTVQDDGGTASGGVDTASATFTITLVPLPPIAGDDAYSTTVLTPLTVDAASGVLANDADVNSSTLVVTPETTSSGLLGGTLTLASDGSFTYQPALNLTGRDRFTYTITDGNGLTATGTITIDVSLSTGAPGSFYLQAGGLSSEVWSLGSTAPAAASPVPDLDADGNPGLTIAGGDGKETITDPKKQQAWVYETGSGSLSVHGPLTVYLTAASDKFAIGKAETLWLYAYDCPGGSSTLSTTGCTLLGQNKVLVSKWSTVADYATHSAVVSIDKDFGPNEQLRIRLLVGGAALWIPLVSPYETRVDYTS